MANRLYYKFAFQLPCSRKESSNLWIKCVSSSTQALQRTFYRNYRDNRTISIWIEYRVACALCNALFVLYNKYYRLLSFSDRGKLIKEAFSRFWHLENGIQIKSCMYCERVYTSTSALFNSMFLWQHCTIYVRVFTLLAHISNLILIILFACAQWKQKQLEFNSHYPSFSFSLFLSHTKTHNFAVHTIYLWSWLNTNFQLWIENFFFSIFTSPMVENLQLIRCFYFSTGR